MYVCMQMRACVCVCVCHLITLLFVSVIDIYFTIRFLIQFIQTSNRRNWIDRTIISFPGPIRIAHTHKIKYNTYIHTPTHAVLIECKYKIYIHTYIHTSYMHTYVFIVVNMCVSVCVQACAC